MATINYDDKVALNENSSIADINKVNASDMNEIKQVVNENANTLDNLLSNTYGTSQTNGYTQEYVNNRTNIFDLIRFENITAEGSYTLAAGGAAYKGATCPTIEGYKPWFCYEVIGKGNAGIRGYTSIPNANNEIGCWVVNVTTSSVTVPGTVFEVMYIKEAS